MATITLYASRVNLMPSVFGTLRNTVSSFNGGIDLLRQGALGIDSSICDLEDRNCYDYENDKIFCCGADGIGSCCL